MLVNTAVSVFALTLGTLTRSPSILDLGMVAKDDLMNTSTSDNYAFEPKHVYSKNMFQWNQWIMLNLFKTGVEVIVITHQNKDIMPFTDCWVCMETCLVCSLAVRKKKNLWEALDKILLTKIHIGKNTKDAILRSFYLKKENRTEVLQSSNSEFLWLA